ncbi:MAG TPA: multiubiquitin domain-containing protein [Allosphingosinicella sp.]|nr:multiubiquitin domain-containing protein [Allosphingosinicella sp.]
MKDDDKDKGKNPKEFELQVNRKPYKWPDASVTGAEIKTLAGSPPDFVVNQIVDGPGEDPEISDNQPVDLSKPGIEKFVTRKPKTTPGA